MTDEARVTQPTTDLTATLAEVLPPIVVGGQEGGWRFDEDETARRIVAALAERGVALRADRPPEPPTPTPEQFRDLMRALIYEARDMVPAKHRADLADYLVRALGASPPPPDLSELRALVDRGPHWSPHPDIRDSVPVDPEWGASLIAVADVRAALASQPPSTPREP